MSHVCIYIRPCTGHHSKNRNSIWRKDSTNVSLHRNFSPIAFRKFDFEILLKLFFFAQSFFCHRRPAWSRWQTNLENSVQGHSSGCTQLSEFDPVYLGHAAEKKLKGVFFSAVAGRQQMLLKVLHFGGKMTKILIYNQPRWVKKNGFSSSARRKKFF